MTREKDGRHEWPSAGLRWEGVVGRKADAIRAHGEPWRQSEHDGVLASARLVGSATTISPVFSIVITVAVVVGVVAVAVPTAPSTAAAAASSVAPSGTAAAAAAAAMLAHTGLIVPFGRLGTVMTALVGLHAPADSLGRHACANLDVGLLDREARDDGATAAAAKWRRQHPLAVRFGQLVDGDDADARLVVAAVAGTVAHAPSRLSRTVSTLSTSVSRRGTKSRNTYPELEIRGAILLHGLFRDLGVFAKVHLDEGVSLVPVHDARLHLAVLAEELSELGLGAAVA